MINYGAAVVAPQQELDLFAHRLQATGKTWSHHGVHRNGPGSVAIEFGGWTVEVSWNSAGARRRH